MTAMPSSACLRELRDERAKRDDIRSDMLAPLECAGASHTESLSMADRASTRGRHFGVHPQVYVAVGKDIPAATRTASTPTKLRLSTHKEGIMSSRDDDRQLEPHGVRVDQHRRHRYGAAQAPVRQPSPDVMVRASAVAAILGGCLVTAAAVLLALQPAGCVGADCAIRPMRTTPPDIVAIGASATLLIAIGLAGLTRLATRTRPHLALARSVRICGASGLTVLFAGLLSQAAFFNGDLFLMPVVVAVGGLLILASLTLLLVLLFRTQATPRWLTIAFGASSLLLIAMNEQTTAILFVVPFAVTMAALGIAMIAASANPRTRSAPTDVESATSSSPSR